MDDDGRRARMKKEMTALKKQMNDLKAESDNLRKRKKTSRGEAAAYKKDEPSFVERRKRVVAQSSKTFKPDRLTIERALKEANKKDKFAEEGVVGFLHYAAEETAREKDKNDEFTRRLLGWKPGEGCDSGDDDSSSDEEDIGVGGTPILGEGNSPRLGRASTPRGTRMSTPRSSGSSPRLTRASTPKLIKHGSSSGSSPRLMRASTPKLTKQGSAQRNSPLRGRHSTPHAQLRTSTTGVDTPPRGGVDTPPRVDTPVEVVENCYSDPFGESGSSSPSQLSVTDHQGYLNTPPLFAPSSYFCTIPNHTQLEEEEEDSDGDEAVGVGVGLGSDLYSNPESNLPRLLSTSSNEDDDDDDDDEDEWGTATVPKSPDDLLTREFKEKRETEKKGQRRKIGSTVSTTLNFPSFGGVKEDGEGGFGFVDWNARFQKCVEKLSDNSSFDVSEQMAANSELMELYIDFIYTSRTIGRTIISEVFLPDDKKTIKPKSLGGMAGGEKYIVQNILFKFAIDSSNLFQGSHLAPGKVANHELTGLMSYFSLSMKGLHQPLMVLVDYRGFRLVAMSVLPLSSTSLIYGTGDGGATIVKKNKEFNKMMQKTMLNLNLQPHICGAIKGKTKRLWSAADIEGHLGLDGKFYLLDFSRTMPPCRPNKAFVNGHLYQLFRREFVSSYPSPLCSDAYSGFVAHDPHKADYNLEIDKATRYLESKVIPKFAENFLKKSPYDVDVALELHFSGINLRYIGCVLASYAALTRENKGIEVLDHARVLLIEAIARVIKNVIHRKMRHEMFALKLNLEVPFRRTVIDYLNLVFDGNDASNEWWTSDLPSALKTFYSFSDYPFDTFGIDLRGEVAMANHEKGDELLFEKLGKLLQIEFTKEGHQKFSKKKPLDLLDILRMSDRVKHMGIISSAQGSYNFYKALLEADKNLKMEFLVTAMDKFALALRSMPHNQDTLLKHAVASYHYLLLLAHQKGNIDEDGVYFLFSDPGVGRLWEHLRRALTIHESHPSLLCLQAMVLERVRKYSDAEGVFLSALEADSQFSFALVEYGRFLATRGQPYSVYAPLFKATKGFDCIISPLTWQKMEESLVVCVEWSLTSAECVYVPINPSTQLFGICTEALKALGFKFDPEEWSSGFVETKINLQKRREKQTFGFEEKIISLLREGRSTGQRIDVPENIYVWGLFHRGKGIVLHVRTKGNGKNTSNSLFGGIKKRLRQEEVKVSAKGTHLSAKKRGHREKEREKENKDDKENEKIPRPPSETLSPEFFLGPASSLDFDENFALTPSRSVRANGEFNLKTKNLVKDHIDKVVWSADTKGVLFVAVLKGSSLGPAGRYGVCISFEGKNSPTTRKAGASPTWNEEFNFLVRDIRSSLYIEVFKEEKRRTLTLPFPSTFNNPSNSSVAPTPIDAHSSSLFSDLSTASSFTSSFSSSPTFSASDHLRSTTSFSPPSSPPTTQASSTPLPSPPQRILTEAPTQLAFSSALNKSEIREAVLPSAGRSPRGRMYKSPPIASFEVPLSEILKAEGVVEKSFVVGTGRLNVNLSFEGDTKYEKYLPLQDLLLEPKFKILKALVTTADHEDAGWLTEPLLCLLSWNDKILPFFKRALKQEILVAHSPKTVFRGGGIVIKMLSKFTSEEGKKFLCDLIQPITLELQEEESSQSSPSSSPCPLVTRLTTSLLSSLLTNTNLIPPSILKLCEYLSKIVAAVFPDAVPNILSGYFFLRFLCPAIISPELVLDDFVPTPFIQKKLLLIGKIIQTTANRKTPKKLLPYHPLIVSFFPQINAFFETLKHPKRRQKAHSLSAVGQPIQLFHFNLIHVGLEKSAVIERLLEDKKNERVGRQLEEVLGKLGKPMDQKGVELLGFVDLEKIASDLIRPDIGINHFASSPRHIKRKKEGKKRVFFSAYHLIDWFCVHVPICETREEAVILGNRLLEYKFIRPYLRSSSSSPTFTDTDNLYEVVEAEVTSVYKRYVLNHKEKSTRQKSAKSHHKGTKEEEGGAEEEGEGDRGDSLGTADGLVGLSLDLLDMVGSILRSCLIERDLSTKLLVGAKDQPKFKLFSLSTIELCNINLSLLSNDNDRAAFWLNIYHTLLLHVYIERSPPSSARQLAKFLNTSCYEVGGHVFSLNEIEHGILRASLHRPKSQSSIPGGGAARFAAKDPRRDFMIQGKMPLLTFALSCGSKSCPDIALYYGGTELGASLRLAAIRFLSKHLQITQKKGSVVLRVPKILVWYSRDFGEDKVAFLQSLVPYFDQERMVEVPDMSLLISKKISIKIESEEFDSTLGGSLSLLHKTG